MDCSYTHLPATHSCEPCLQIQYGGMMWWRGSKYVWLFDWVWVVLFYVSVWGSCNHAFHLHCILKWVNSQSPQAHCPMCRREWQFKEWKSEQWLLPLASGTTLGQSPLTTPLQALDYLLPFPFLIILLYIYILWPVADLWWHCVCTGLYEIICEVYCVTNLLWRADPIKLVSINNLFCEIPIVRASLVVLQDLKNLNPWQHCLRCV